MRVKIDNEYVSKLKFIRADVQRVSGIPIELDTVLVSCIDVVYDMVLRTPDSEKISTYKVTEVTSDE